MNRLNFGCGYDKREGYVNADSDPACNPDVLLKDNDLSPLSGTPFDEILARDVLEHVPRTLTLGLLLDLNDLMRDGGRIIVETSSILGVAKKLETYPAFAAQYGWVTCLFGSQTHPGDFHLTGFTDVTLRVHLLAAGFSVESTHVNDDWLLYAESIKTESWTTNLNSDTTNEEYIAQVFQSALGRTPQPHERLYFEDGLSEGRLDRRGAAHTIWSAPERLFIIAERNGFGEK